MGLVCSWLIRYLPDNACVRGLFCLIHFYYRTVLRSWLVLTEGSQAHLSFFLPPLFYRRDTGPGSWDPQGCETVHTQASHTKCLCHQLATFAILAQQPRDSVSIARNQMPDCIVHWQAALEIIFVSLTLLCLKYQYPFKYLGKKQHLLNGTKWLEVCTNTALYCECL